MTGAVAELAALAVLAGALLIAVLRPRGISEALIAVPGAAALVVVGALTRAQAWETVRELLPTVVFLSLILLFAHLCGQEGLFRYVAYRAALASHGDPRRLLATVVVAAALVTATLTLDSTVVLLTPVIAATVVALGVDGRAAVYGCLRLANSGSLLLPVSNLTNLLAFPATGLSFGRFAALMAAPWIVAVLLEWAALRVWFGHTLAGRAKRAIDPVDPPRLALAVAAGTLAGFVALSAAGWSPAWAAGAGALLLAAPRLMHRAIRPRQLLTQLNLGFGAFVLALGVIVEAVARHGLTDAVARFLPDGAGLAALLGIALLAAVLANAVNNIPATMILVPLAAGSPVHLLAVLIGVNVGPNATYVGSLATLLWRRRLPHELRPQGRQFHALGIVATPAVLLASVAALWLSWALIGS